MGKMHGGKKICEHFGRRIGEKYNKKTISNCLHKLKNEMYGTLLCFLLLKKSSRTFALYQKSEKAKLYPISC